MRSPAFGDACPCGSGTLYAACCGPLHRGRGLPESAERLMRSRYAAYALGETACYIFRTWHPRTRPAASTAASPGLVWTGLEVLDTLAGGPDDTTGEVEFRARHQSAGGAGVLHERSRFERRGGRWVYVDAV